MTKPRPPETKKQATPRSPSPTNVDLAPLVKKELQAIQDAVQSVATQIAEQKEENQNIHIDLAKQIGILHEKIDFLFHLVHREEPLPLSEFMVEAKEKGYSPQQWMFIKEMLQFIGAYTIEDLSEEEILKEIERIPGKDLLQFHSDVDLSGWEDLLALPDMIVDGFLDISHCTRLSHLPRDLTVEKDLIVTGCSPSVIQEAHHLKRRGNIGGKVIEKEEEK